MKINEQNENIQFNMGNKQKFKINTSSKAFQILSSNLYSNPIGAIIRELSTNAYDAHKMVNKEHIPFEIILPTILEPNLKIRDYGPGLTSKEIETIYTTFFESTKTDSNDFVGCLGLGSKTPFSVTDIFTINSYKDGKKIVYSAFLDEMNIPNVSKIFEQETEEVNGLEIIIPFEEKYFERIKDEIKNQLKYFKVKPIIKNGSIEWEENEYIFEKPNEWGIGFNNHINIIQGQIAYPIYRADMQRYFKDYIKYFDYQTVDIFVEIGDVNIAPSREILYFDKRTIKFLENKFEKLIQEIVVEIQKKIDEQKTYYDALLYIQKLKNNFNNFTNRILSVNKFYFNGEELNKIYLKKQIDFVDYFLIEEMRRKEQIALKKQRFQKSYLEKEYPIQITESPYYFISANNDFEKEYEKLKKYIKENNLYTRHRINSYIIVSDKSFVELEKKLRGKHLIDVGKLELKVKDKKIKKRRSNKVNIYKFNKLFYYLNDSMHRVEVKFEENIEGYFCIINNKKPILKNKTLDIELFREYYNFFEFHKGKNLYFISERNYNKYKEYFDKHLQNFEEEIEKYFQKNEDKIILYNSSTLPFDGKIFYRLPEIKELLKTRSNDFSTLINIFEKNKFIEKYEVSKNRIVNFFNEDVDKFKKNYDIIIPLIEKEFKKYPMLEYILSSSRNLKDEKFKADFVKYVEKIKKAEK
jgi:hypothetical protein